MTIGELTRVIESRKRVQKEQARERAGFDYILADLIGRSISRVYNSSNKMPKLSEAYASLFTEEEIEEKEEQIQTKKDELSALRFKQFAQAYNQKIKGVG